ncbi:hypothetical protein GYH30_006715 [Glycine max]|nr:hypothetical protein GYH30_006715 [Glycine max]
MVNNIEDEEALETSTVVFEFSNGGIGVVAFGKVVGGIFLARDELFGVEDLIVGVAANFIKDGGKIDEDDVHNMLVRSSFAKEGVESVMGHTEGDVHAKITPVYSRSSQYHIKYESVDVWS